MSEQLIDLRTPISTSKSVRVEIGQDDIVHVLAGAVSLHVERQMFEELSLTMARGLVRLRERDNPPPPVLRLVRELPGDSEC